VRFLGLMVFLSASFTSINYAQTLTNDSIKVLAQKDIYDDATAAIYEKNLTRAVELLELLSKVDPQNVGGRLDLASIYCQLGLEKNARAVINELKSDLPSISDKVENLSAVVMGNCSNKAQSSVTWNSYFEVARGSSSNVNLGAIQRDLIAGPIDNPFLLSMPNESMPHRDSFTDYKVGTYATIGSTDQISATIAARELATQSQFNELITNLDWKHQLTSGPWQAILTGDHKLAVINNLVYSNAVLLGADLFTPFGLMGGRFFAGIDQSATNYAQANVFNIHGTHIKTGIKWPSGAQFEIGWRNNKAINNRPGGNSSGRQIKGQYGFSFAQGWRFSTLGQAQSMQDKEIFFPGLFDIRRAQNSWSVIARVEHNIAPNWVTGLDYSNFSQADNIPIFSYKGQELRLWLLKNF